MNDRYILLPAEGIRGKVSVPTVSRARRRQTRQRDELRFETLSLGGEYSIKRAPAAQVPVKVVDEVAGEGPKLVELSPREARELRRSGKVRVMREHFYRPAVIPELPIAPPPGAESDAEIEIEVECAKTASPLEGARVTALVDVEERLGATGVSDGQGKVRLALGAPPVDVATLLVLPPRSGSWGAYATDIVIQASHSVALEPVDLNFQPPDILRHFYGASAPGKDGKGVRVGVIDTGIGDHKDLMVSGGANTVAKEPDGAYGDNGLGHGTHVAGIIAANGAAPQGIRGLAPDAELLSYRVYGDGKEVASNYSITKALWEAAEDECDLVNISSEAPEPDRTLRDAIADANEHGIVVVCSAGNGGRQPVAAPARYAVAVSALGRIHTFPAGSFEESEVATPSGSDPDDFLAGFSNIGAEVTFVAPGLGVVSTISDGYGPETGTSMAAAAVTGIAARLLADDPGVMAMPRDADRSKAILELLTKRANSMGLGPTFEGFGML